MSDSDSRSSSRRPRRLGRGLASLMANTRPIEPENKADDAADGVNSEIPGDLAGNSVDNSGDSAASGAADALSVGVSGANAAGGSEQGTSEPARGYTVGAPVKAAGDAAVGDAADSKGDSGSYESVSAAELVETTAGGSADAGVVATDAAASDVAPPAEQSAAVGSTAAADSELAGETASEAASEAASGTANDVASVLAAGDVGVAGGPVEIDCALIKPNPYQPRRDFDDAELSELTESIRAQGVLQPLLVAAGDGDSYILIAGERRLRAASLAGLASVPCVIRQATREQMAQWAIIENVQRSDLNPIEKAQAYRQYIDSFYSTQAQLSEKLGLPRSTIANHLRLLDLCDATQSAVASGSLSFGHAKVLAALTGRQREQEKLTQKVIDNSLSVRQLEQLVAQLVNSDKAIEAIDAIDAIDAEASAAARPANSEYIQDVERQLTRVVGSKVAIKPAKKSGRGKIVLSYNSLDEFDHITEVLGVKLES